MVSLPVFIRKIIGRRGVFIARNILSELAYHTGLYEYADSTNRLNGISALMCTHNEEDWVEASILSIKDFVDEIVIVDSSSDRTLELATSMASEHGIPVRTFKIPPGDIALARTIALRESSYKWLIVHDADVVLNNNSGRLVRELIESLNPRRHYLVYWKYLLLCGDIYHVCGENQFHIEHWLFTYSNKLGYKYMDFGGGKYMEVLIAPLELYKPIYLNRILGVHLTLVRSPEKLSVKYIRLEHRKLFMDYIKHGLNDEEATRRIARELYGIDNLQELGSKLIKDLTSKLPKYDESKYGPLPRILVEYAQRRVGS